MTRKRQFWVAIEAIRRTLPLKAVDAFLAPWRGLFNLPDSAGTRAVFQEVASRLRRGLSISLPWGIAFDPNAVLDEITLKEAMQALRREVEGMIGDSSEISTVIILDQLDLLTTTTSGHEAASSRYLLQQLQELLKTTFHSSILFILGAREERLGSLVMAAPDILNPRILQTQPIHPLAPDQARDLLIRSAKAAPNNVSFSTPIVDSLIELSELEPSSLQLTAYFFWEALEEQGMIQENKAVHMPVSEIYELLSGRLEDRYWDYLSKPTRETLKLIAQYQPLDKAQLVRLAQEKNIANVDEALDSLLGSSLRPVRYAPQSDRFTITHDLLTRYILSQVPDEERDIVLLEKIIAEAVRLYSTFGRLLSERELEKIWALRGHLQLSSGALEVILRSEILREKPQVTRWGKSYPDQTAILLGKILSENPTDKQEQSIAEWLSSIDSLEVHSPLAILLKQPNPDVRKTAALSLSYSRHPDSALALIVAIKDGEPQVRAAAAKALGNLKAVAAVNALGRCLDDERPEVVSAAATALEAIGGSASVDLLLQHLNSDNKFTRLQVCRALGNAGIQEAVTYLVQALSDGESDVRFEAARALAKLTSEKAIEGLEQALHDESLNVFRAVAGALGAIGHSMAIEILSRELASSEPYRRRIVAEQLLVVEPQDNVLGILKNMYSDVPDHAQLWILQILSARDTKHIRLYILEALDSSSSNIRRFAIQTIGKVWCADLEELLIEHLERENDWSLRRDAVRILGRSGSKLAKATLGKIADEEAHSFVGQIARRYLTRAQSGKSQRDVVSQLIDSRAHTDEMQEIISQHLSFARNRLLEDEDYDTAMQRLLEDEDMTNKLSGVLANSLLEHVPSKSYVRAVEDLLNWADATSQPLIDALVRWAVAYIVFRRELPKVSPHPIFDYFGVDWWFDGIRHEAWFVRNTMLKVFLDSDASVFAFKQLPEVLFESESSDKSRLFLNRQDVVETLPYREKYTSRIFIGFTKEDDLIRGKTEALMRLGDHYKIPELSWS